MQLDPSTKATIAPTLGTNQAPTWQEIVTAGMTISARQNGGTPLLGRTCQPELKLCNTALFFDRNDGTKVMLRAAEDAMGKSVARDICEFNKFEDVRMCMNWETGVSIREMKNKEGNWIKVGDE
jgi:hypothetical protein